MWLQYSFSRYNAEVPRGGQGMPGKFRVVREIPCISPKCDRIIPDGPCLLFFLFLFLFDRTPRKREVNSAMVSGGIECCATSMAISVLLGWRKTSYPGLARSMSSSWLRKQLASGSSELLNWVIVSKSDLLVCVHCSQRGICLRNKHQYLEVFCSVMWPRHLCIFARYSRCVSIGITDMRTVCTTALPIYQMLKIGPE